MCQHLKNDIFSFFQWKNADETQFMDSKLECVFPMERLRTGGAGGRRNSYNQAINDHYVDDEAAKNKSTNDEEGFKFKVHRFFNGDFFQHKYQRF